MRFTINSVLTVLAAALLCVLFSTDVNAEAAEHGSLKLFPEITEEQQQAAAELSGIKDTKAEYEAAYKKAKWNDNFDKTDLKYMACIIYCEARGMGYDAKAAVANVVLNRMYDEDDWKHVSTVYDVIYDKGPNGKWGTQFSPTKDGSMKKALAIYADLNKGINSSATEELMKECIRIAKAVFKGYKAVPDDFMYFNSHLQSQSEKCEKNGWSYTIIERHIYYNQNSENWMEE